MYGPRAGMSIYDVVRLNPVAGANAKLMACLPISEPLPALGVTSAMDKRVIFGVAASGLCVLILGLAIPAPLRVNNPAAQGAGNRDFAKALGGHSGKDGEEVCEGGFFTYATALNTRKCVKPGSGQSFRDCPDCPELVAVPAGEFMMGSSESEEGRYENEGPLHKVTIAKPFAVGRFSITVAEYLACMKEGACKPAEWQQPGGKYNISTGSDPLYKRLRESLTGDRYPIIGVTWDDAKAYVKWLSDKTEKDYRLLSEAEFEYAARAGARTPFWWGASISTSQANFNGTRTYAGSEESEYRTKPVPVKSFLPNPWGLYQMHGNVWSWIEDCWVADTYEGAPADGSALKSGKCGEHVLRGGSWNNAPRAVRAAIRSHFGGESAYIGFRVARSLFDEPKSSAQNLPSIRGWRLRTRNTARAARRARIRS
jgi:formylglycine-generating enzyme required for sulfatase activity